HERIACPNRAPGRALRNDNAHRGGGEHSGEAVCIGAKGEAAPVNAANLDPGAEVLDRIVGGGCVREGCSEGEYEKTAQESVSHVISPSPQTLLLNQRINASRTARGAPVASSTIRSRGVVPRRQAVPVSV